MSPESMKGLELSRLFHEEAVKPILNRHFPRIPYSAGLLGVGSEVMGFDDEESRDHNWGPRLFVFIPEADYPSLRRQLLNCLASQLPYEFRGWPTNWTGHNHEVMRLMEVTTNGDVNHRVEVHTIRRYFHERLGVDPFEDIQPTDWLTFSDQALIWLVGGGVWHDGLGQLTRLRRKFAYYPYDIWLYMLAGQWRRIYHEESYVGRCGAVGDEIGSRLIATRLIGDLVRLCFFMERRYAPYSKWVMTGFEQLSCAKRLLPGIADVLNAQSWVKREACLSKVYEEIVSMHNDLGITEWIEPKVSTFFSRPYKVIYAARFVDALEREIRDPQVRALTRHLGTIDQYCHSTAVLRFPGLRRRMKELYSGFKPPPENYR